MSKPIDCHKHIVIHDDIDGTYSVERNSHLQWNGFVFGAMVYCKTSAHNCVRHLSSDDMQFSNIAYHCFDKPLIFTLWKEKMRNFKQMGFLLEEKQKEMNWANDNKVRRYFEKKQLAIVDISADCLKKSEIKSKFEPKRREYRQHVRHFCCGI